MQTFTEVEIGGWSKQIFYSTSDLSKVIFWKDPSKNSNFIVLIYGLWFGGGT